ncbi:hypothetical protein BG000_005335 [Podila horticola]|nr:hypothetical protein BG000_005335 [Podila horticola]
MSPTLTTIDLSTEGNTLPPPHATTPIDNTENNIDLDADADAEEDTDAGGATTNRRFEFRKESPQELLLLRALAEERPFIAPFRSIDKTWEKVVQYLRDSDAKERPTKPYFTHLKLRSCKLAWKKIYDEVEAYQHHMEIATGIAPEESERRVLMRELYLLKKSNDSATDKAKEDKTKKQESAAEDRRLGQLLLDIADGSATSDSDNAPRPTAHSKKRVTIQHLQQQHEEAISEVKEQRELVAQQVELQKEAMALQKEAMEHRKMKEEWAVQREQEQEARMMEWKREKQKDQENREEKRKQQEYERDERRHKETMEIFRQQQRMMEFILNTFQQKNQ